jgi:hypothetical protein
MPLCIILLKFGVSSVRALDEREIDVHPADQTDAQNNPGRDQQRPKDIHSALSQF